MTVSGTITIEITNDPVWSRAMDAAYQLVYERRGEWSGVFTIDRYKLRNLIVDEMMKFHKEETERTAAAPSPVDPRPPRRGLGD